MLFPPESSARLVPVTKQREHLACEIWRHRAAKTVRTARREARATLLSLARSAHADSVRRLFPPATNGAAGTFTHDEGEPSVVDDYNQSLVSCQDRVTSPPLCEMASWGGAPRSLRAWLATSMTNTRLNDLLIIKGLRLIVDRRLIQDITSPANLPFHPVTIPSQPWPRYGVFAPYALTREKAPSFEFRPNRCRQNHPRARRRHRGATDTSTGARQKQIGRAHV